MIWSIFFDNFTQNCLLFSMCTPLGALVLIVSPVILLWGLLNIFKIIGQKIHSATIILVAVVYCSIYQQQ